MTVIERTDPAFLAVCRGDAPADLLLRGGQIVNVFTRELCEADVAIFGGRIAGVGKYTDGESVMDVGGCVLAPGFIDAHMHVESTMMSPAEFVRVAAPRGTTGVVFDPHEIANVLGVPGIRWLMQAAEGLPMHILFAVSSCVPASHLETSGARLEAADLEPLFDDDRVVALAEMMNYPGVVHADAGVLAKVRLGLARAIVDGHAPGLAGQPLQAYVAAGVSSDHECSTLEEAAEKLALGMTIYIREGSAARNLEALAPLVTQANAHQICFCTDDRHPADLEEEGHIDHVVRTAIDIGIDPCTAIAMASLHVARHYRRADMGAIAPGCLADIAVLEDLTTVRARTVLCAGEVVGEGGKFVAESGVMKERAPAPASPIRIPQGLCEGSFRVPAVGEGCNIRVIGLRPGQLLTDALHMSPRIVSGDCVVDTDRDILKLAVIERHRATGNIGLGFVKGFGFASGALASTVGHDSHNLTIVGATDADMLLAARTVEKMGGGHCVVRDGQVLSTFALPIGGLMSDQSASAVAEMQRALLRASSELGCPMADPFMPLSFLPLCVIPTLKLSDLGLVDVDRFEIVSLEAPPE